ncbi:MAG: CRISPR-associated protein Cas2 [Treponema sp.]|nr:CRISPR-associated protein Cas2 [Treponema sp.]
MFVSVVLDPGSPDTARAMVSILTQMGFKKSQRSCYENMKVSVDDLAKLKREIDRVTDYYDSVRFYQFPVGGLFVITELKEKRWRKCQFQGNPVATGSRTGAKAAAAKRGTAGRPVARRPGSR